MYKRQSQVGLYGQPTLVHNVETLACVPHIVLRGPEWFASIGTEESKGPKLFCVSGHVERPGLYELPMGTTLREIIYEHAGGVWEGRKLKAVIPGGASTPMLTPEHLDVPMAFETLPKVGSMLGTGAVIVMDETTCMVDVARYFLGFTLDESCGKCTACREGGKRMYEILDRIVHGQGREGDIELLEELSQAMKEGSLCALGRMAPNPVLTTIRYFRDEYEAHIREKRCPAGVCTDLITFSIIEENCTGCGVCLRNCPQGAISGEKKKPHVIDPDKCIRCGICREVCKFDAIRVE